jgi:hypothetical protein
MTGPQAFRTETRTVDPLNAGREIDDGTADILKEVGGDRQRAEVGGHWTEKVPVGRCRPRLCRHHRHTLRRDGVWSSSSPCRGCVVARAVGVAGREQVVVVVAALSASRRHRCIALSVIVAIIAGPLAGFLKKKMVSGGNTSVMKVGRRMVGCLRRLRSTDRFLYHTTPVYEIGVDAPLWQS